MSVYLAIYLIAIEKGGFYDLLRDGGILSAFLASVRLLLIKDEDVKTKMKTWLAGILAGIAGIFACHLLEVPDKATIIVVLAVSPFISTIFPIYERWAKKWASKNTEEK